MRTWLALLLVLAGCGGEVTPTDGGVDAPDAWVAPPPFTGELDLLLVIDDSSGTDEEQLSLAMAIPAAMHRLLTGDAATPGVTSLHVGIVTSDMGIGDVHGISGCDAPGDDGLMQIATRVAHGSCAPSYADAFAATPNVFAFPSGAIDEGTFGSDVACVSLLGSHGCGFESHLESMLKAVSLEAPTSWTRPGYAPPTFFAGTHGHGGEPATNGAFLRPGSVLAILVMGDEDDCSAADDAIFELQDPITPGVDLGVRCQVHADRLQPIARYVDGLVGLHDPSRIVYAALTGMPPELDGHDAAEILADPAMQLHVDDDNHVAPACVDPGGRGVAYAGVRHVQLAQALASAHANVLAVSICDSDYDTPIDAFVDLTQRVMRNAR